MLKSFLSALPVGGVTVFKLMVEYLLNHDCLPNSEVKEAFYLYREMGVDCEMEYTKIFGEPFPVKVPFTWIYGGSEVKICGDFTDNLEIPVPKYGVTFRLVPGKIYRYRFLIDGEWKIDSNHRSDSGFNVYRYPLPEDSISLIDLSTSIHLELKNPLFDPECQPLMEESYPGDLDLSESVFVSPSPKSIPINDPDMDQILYNMLLNVNNKIKPPTSPSWSDEPPKSIFEKFLAKYLK